MNNKTVDFDVLRLRVVDYFESCDATYVAARELLSRLQLPPAYRQFVLSESELSDRGLAQETWVRIQDMTQRGITQGIFLMLAVPIG